MDQSQPEEQDLSDFEGNRFRAAGDPGVEPFRGVRKPQPVPLRVGQALLVGLSLVHGGGVNSSGSTRFSTDIRVANSLAPVTWSRGVHADYFVPLCSSPITRIARAYLAANAPDSEPSR